MPCITLTSWAQVSDDDEVAVFDFGVQGERRPLVHGLDAAVGADLVATGKLGVFNNLDGYDVAWLKGVLLCFCKK